MHKEHKVMQDLLRIKKKQRVTKQGLELLHQGSNSLLDESICEANAQPGSLKYAKLMDSLYLLMTFSVKDNMVKFAKLNLLLIS